MPEQSTQPDPTRSVEALEESLSHPPLSVVDLMRTLPGDILILGVGGKMGPTLARMAKRASDEAGVQRRIIGVSRFSNASLPRQLNDVGVETIPCDLLDEKALAILPDCLNVISMTGFKFGTGENAPTTWAVNTYLPALLCQRFRHSHIVAFSTGNVYPLVPHDSKGSAETDAPAPVGEYGMSALGRERIFQYFSQEHQIPMALIRLNYACELRYGVLVDVALKVQHEQPVPLAMGYFNTIWQGDANAAGILALDQIAMPPRILNLTGPEVLSVRTVAEAFGRHLQKTVRFEGTESPNALLSNSTLCREMFGPPTVLPEQLIAWIADWIRHGGPTLDKPTHFEVRDGRF